MLTRGALRWLVLVVVVQWCLPTAARAQQDGELTAVSIHDGQVLPTNASVFAGVRGAGQNVLAHLTQGTALPDVTATQVGSDSWGAVHVYRMQLPFTPGGDVTVDVQAPAGERLLHVVSGSGPDNTAPVFAGTPTISAKYVDRTHYNIAMELEPPSDEGGIGYYMVNLSDGGTVGFQVHNADARTSRTQVFFYASGSVPRPCYVVVATDLAGNTSLPSAPACVDLDAARPDACGCQQVDGDSGSLGAVAAVLLVFALCRLKNARVGGSRV